MLRSVAVSMICLVSAFPSITKVNAQEKFMADKVIAVVGNSAVLFSDMSELSKQVLQQRREQGFTLDRDASNEALEQLLMQKLLYNQALIDSVEVELGDLPSAVEESVQQMIKETGSLAALESMHHKPIFDIKEDLRIKYEEMRYAQRMQQIIRDKVKITPGEVERYYRSIPKDSLPIIPEQYIYAQICKFPVSTQEAKQRVKERMLELRERIVAGTRFDVLARMYSVDGSAVKGGEMDPTPSQGFVKPFASALEKLKPGQISEVVETEFGFHIIELIEKSGNLYKCRHILLRPVFTDAELMNTNMQLDSIVTQIRAGEITFEQAAIKNSDDKYSRLSGGRVSNHDMLEMYSVMDAKMTSTRFLKEELPREDFMAIRNMQHGDVSDAFQTQDMKGNVQSKVIKLIEVIPAHPASLKEDYLRLEEVALVDKQDREFRIWLDKKIASMYVRIDPEYRGGEFENKSWLK